MASGGFSQTSMSCDTMIEDAPSIQTFACSNVLFQGQYSSTCEGRSSRTGQDPLDGSNETRLCDGCHHVRDFVFVYSGVLVLEPCILFGRLVVVIRCATGGL